MLQSVANIKKLDMSFNPIDSIIRLSGERTIIDDKQTENDGLSDDTELTEILCIDQLDLNNCRIKHLPNLEHTCINKLGLAYNRLNGRQHLVISRFSTYFLDYLDLQWNNITELKPIISRQKFKQDSYRHKNSPLQYFLGSQSSVQNSKIHTYIDLKSNRFFKCDCDNLIQFKKYAAIQILNNCTSDVKFQSDCFSKDHQSMQSLNRKFRSIFVMVSLLLIILTSILVYYMCSDCIKNLHPIENIQFYFRQFFYRFAQSRMDGSDGMGVTGNIRQPGSSKVIYSKLDNEVTASNVDLHINS